jgi:hypothetical protein
VITLEVSADPALPSVSQLDALVTDAAKRTATTSAPVNASIPPALSLSLVLPADVSGAVTVELDALDKSGAPAARLMRVVQVHPSEVMSVAVSFGAAQPGDACSAPCSTNLDSCTSMVGQIAFPGGYCSTVCDSGQTMGNCTSAGGECQYVQGLFMCLARCHPAQGASCRSGYDCCDGSGRTQTSGWCAPSSSSLCGF